MFNLTSGQGAPMTDTRISPLRQRMIDDMTIRKMASKTQAAYIRAIKNFTIFLGRRPRHPGAARPQEAGDHGALCPGRDADATRGQEPARGAHQEGQAARVERGPVSRPGLEVADIFRAHGPAWRHANAGHVSLDQLKVMSAITHCRTAILGGHLMRCEKCAHEHVAYNSCRNRHCPKCQGAAATDWLAAREAELLPVPYCHVVFTVPAQIADIAYQNKAVVYDILFKEDAIRMPAATGAEKSAEVRHF